MINNIISSGLGGFDGVALAGGGLTASQTVLATQAVRRVLDVGSLSELPPPIGGVITLTDTGPYNVINVNRPLDISPNRLVLDGVAIESNGGAGSSIVSYVAGDALISNADNTAIRVRDVSLGNFAPLGSIFNLINTNGIALGKSAEIANLTIIQADTIGLIANYILLDLMGIAILGLVNGGLTIGTPTVPGAVLITIERMFTLNEPTTGGNIINFDTTIPVGAILSLDKLNILAKAGFFGISISNIANIGGLKLSNSFFGGSGEGISGFNGESPNVIITECTGKILNTPTDYWAEYHDNATQLVAVPLPYNTDVKITNDGVNGIEKHLPATIPNLWDVVNDKVLLTGVPLGRALTIIVELTLNFTANGNTVRLEARGLDTAVTTSFADTIFINQKTTDIFVRKEITIGAISQDLIDNGIELYIKLIDPLTSGGTMKVNSIRVKRN